MSFYHSTTLSVSIVLRPSEIENRRFRNSKSVPWILELFPLAHKYSLCRINTVQLSVGPRASESETRDERDEGTEVSLTVWIGRTSFNTPDIVIYSVV